jgi:class 3 adenylate cyclase
MFGVPSQGFTIGENVSMPAIRIEHTQIDTFNTVSRQAFDSFSIERLGIGDVSREGFYVQALVAVYDLEGFTSFCNQVDSHLVLPEFLARYLEWLFETMRTRFLAEDLGDQVKVWGSLPIFVKFMGDGLLVIWDRSLCGTGMGGMRNIVLTAYEIASDYSTQFYPVICQHVSNAPFRLRCGFARGQVIAVGDGSDYVGSCINIASRLQKLGGLSFAVSRRGLDLSVPSTSKNPLWKELILKKVELRGIGPSELVWVRQPEFDALTLSDQALFRSPNET